MNDKEENVCCEEFYQMQQYLIDKFAEVGIEVKRGKRRRLDPNKSYDGVIGGYASCPYCGAKIT